MSQSHLPAESVFKILRPAEYDVLERFGRFAGSPDDERDGFIHLSFAHQVSATAAKYFTGTDIVIVELSASSMGDGLRYEASRGGALFPHLYGAIVRSMVGEPLRVLWAGDSHPINVPGTLRLHANGPFAALVAADLPQDESQLEVTIRERGLVELLVGTGDAPLEAPTTDQGQRLVALRTRLRAAEAR